jgi:hypothetical protein
MVDDARGADQEVQRQDAVLTLTSRRPHRGVADARQEDGAGSARVLDCLRQEQAVLVVVQPDTVGAVAPPLSPSSRDRGSKGLGPKRPTTHL